VAAVAVAVIVIRRLPAKAAPEPRGTASLALAVQTAGDPA
jgi:hypothetical protein